MFVVDASVIYKWYVNEEFSDKAKELLDNFVTGKVELSAPDLIYYEVANALRWNPRNQVEDIKAVVENLDALELDIVVPTVQLLQSAVETAYKFNLTLYDAIYFGLAEEMKFTFITADQKLYEKIKDQKNVKLLKDLSSLPS